jgi:putative transposase
MGISPKGNLFPFKFYDIMCLIPNHPVSNVFAYEYTVNPNPQQIAAMNEAIRTSQFVRNKVLRYWMDNRGVGKTDDV